MPTFIRRHRSVVPQPRRSGTVAVTVLAAIAALTLALTSPAADAAAISAWSFAPVPGTGPAPAAHVLDVSCAGRRLCVALDDAGNALSTTLPPSTLGGWQSTPVSPGLALNDVSCTTSGFCAAVGVDSWMATTSQPTGAGAAWSLKDLGLFSDSDQSGHSSDELLAVGCESASLCAAVSYSSARNLIVSLDPGATSPVWDSHSVGSVRSGALFYAVACPARSLCVGAASDGKVATSTDAGAHWRQTYVDEPRLRHGGGLTPSIYDVSCPATSFCAAVDNHRTVITSRNATGGASAWHRVRLRHRHWLTAISCASASLCVALDRRGHALASTRPAGPASGWKLLPVAQPISRVSCASNRLCLFATRAGELIAGTRMA